MARGKKTDYDTVYKVMVSWFVTHSYSETARQLDMPITTVRDIVNDNIDKPDFVNLRKEKENEFADKATEIIDKGLILLTKRLSRAIEHEEDLDELIDDIWDIDDDEMSYKDKDKLVNKIKTLQLQNIKDITTAIGTLYDKRALSRGDSTQNIDFATNLDLNRLIDIAGYTKKDDE
jgi:hypothetical protein